MKQRTILYLEPHLLDLHDAYSACECDAEREEKEADIRLVKQIIEWLKTVESQPAPIDPHTCELMVGDVVEFKGSICVLFNTKNYFYLVHQQTGVNLGTNNRSELILTQRAGVQIG